MGTIFVDKLDPQSGTSLEIGSSGDTITIPSGCTLTNNGVMSGQNYPAFHAYLSSTVEVTNAANTKLAANTEVLDTDNCYDNSTKYRFQPTTAGKYFVYGLINGQTNGYRLYFVKTKIYKNGSEVATNGNTINDNVLYRLGVSVQSIVDMNGSSDYLELFGQVDIHANGTEQFLGASTQPCYFGAYRIGS